MSTLRHNEVKELFPDYFEWTVEDRKVEEEDIKVLTSKMQPLSVGRSGQKMCTVMYERTNSRMTMQVVHSKNPIYNTVFVGFIETADDVKSLQRLLKLESTIVSNEVTDEEQSAKDDSDK